MRLVARTSATGLIIILFSFLLKQPIFASTTPFRNANTITTDGNIPYTNLSNCSITDGNTCDRASGSSFANLYFRDFGSLEDFGIPQGSISQKLEYESQGRQMKVYL